MDKIKTDGLMATLEAVFNKLGQPLPLGYCNVGKVIGVGESVYLLSLGYIHALDECKNKVLE